MNYANEQKRKMVRDDYDAIAKLYASEDRNINLYSHYIDKFINKLNGREVLDVGCAAGEFTNYLHEQDLNVIGIDFSENLLKIAKERFKNLDFVNCDICEYKTNQKFDGIFSKDTLFHLPDEDLSNVVGKFYALLNKNGKLLIILDIPKTAGEEIYDEPLNPNFKLYYNYLTVEKIQSILLEHNFKIEKTEYIVSNDNLYVYAQGIMAIYATKS